MLGRTPGERTTAHLSCILDRVGDVLGLAGLLVSAAGFAVTLYQLRRVRRSSEAAQAASRLTSHKFRTPEALALSTA